MTIFEILRPGIVVIIGTLLGNAIAWYFIRRKDNFVFDAFISLENRYHHLRYKTAYLELIIDNYCIKKPKEELTPAQVKELEIIERAVKKTECEIFGSYDDKARNKS